MVPAGSSTCLSKVRTGCRILNPVMRPHLLAEPWFRSNFFRIRIKVNSKFGAAVLAIGGHPSRVKAKVKARPSGPTRKEDLRPAALDGSTRKRRVTGPSHSGNMKPRNYCIGVIDTIAQGPYHSLSVISSITEGKEILSCSPSPPRRVRRSPSFSRKGKATLPYDCSWPKEVDPVRPSDWLWTSQRLTIRSSMTTA